METNKYAPLKFIGLSMGVIATILAIFIPIGVLMNLFY